MYSIYVEQQPSTSFNKYLDYLLYQEQLKKEQEALYYYRLRQQRQRAYLQELQRRQEQERQRRLILEYYQQQEKLRQEKARQQLLLQQQEKLRRQRLYQQQLEQQRRVFTFPSFTFHQRQEEEKQDNEDDEKLAQLVDFLYGSESSSSEVHEKQEDPQKQVLSLGEFLEYISKKAQELDSDNDEPEQGPSSSKPVTQEAAKTEHNVVSIPISEPATEEVSPVVETATAPIAEAVSEIDAEPVTVTPAKPTAEIHADFNAEAASDSVAETTSETVTEAVSEPAAEDVSEPIAEVASIQELEDGSSTIQLDNQVLTVDEFVDYISNKSKELFEEDQESCGEQQESKQVALEDANEGSPAVVVDEKQEKFKLLQGIRQELEDIRKGNEQHILSTQLDFSHSDDDSVSATTTENREFLGYEDQIMKVLLKLDTIDSDGDEEIRTERKNLVKFAETMLNRLDEFKQKEWERASASSHSEVEEDDYLYV